MHRIDQEIPEEMARFIEAELPSFLESGQPERIFKNGCRFRRDGGNVLFLSPDESVGVEIKLEERRMKPEEINFANDLNRKLLAAFLGHIKMASQEGFEMSLEMCNAGVAGFLSSYVVSNGKNLGVNPLEEILSICQGASKLAHEHEKRVCGWVAMDAENIDDELLKMQPRYPETPAEA